MRAGDRDAAGEFLTRYGPLIRRRFRDKLGRALRRHFDSQDLLSTVMRRLDLFVRGGRLAAADQHQLWKLVFRIADHAIIDKLKVLQRLQTVDVEDEEWAMGLAARIEYADRISAEGAADEVRRVMSQLPDQSDRDLLTMWLTGLPNPQIAEELGVSEAVVRKRWQRLRGELRSLCAVGQSP